MSAHHVACTAGSNYHRDYFHEKGLRDERMRNAVIDRHKNQYRMFGAVSALAIHSTAA